MIGLLLLAAASTFAGHTPVGDMFLRDVPGSAFKEVEVRGDISAPPWAVRQIVLSPSSFGLVPYLSEERIVGSDRCVAGASRIPGCKVHWLYTRVRPPFVAPRDYTVRVELTRDDLLSGGKFQLKWEIAPDRGPSVPSGTVRLLANSGEWLLQAQGSMTAFVYKVFNDPGGKLPAWIVNSGTQREIPRMIAAVQKAAKDLVAKHPELANQPR